MTTMGGCSSSAISPTIRWMSESSDLEGIGVLELKALLKNLKDVAVKGVQTDITLLKRHKPVTNYKLEKIPCTEECKRKHNRPHYQFVRIGAPKHSLITIAAHLKAARLTQECTLWLSPLQQQSVDRLYEQLDELIFPSEQPLSKNL